MDFASLYTADEITEFDEASLRNALERLPCCTTRRDGNGEGDPLNFAVVGSFDDVIGAFGSAGWDEAERLSKGSAWRTFKAFYSGSHYRSSPVSNLYAFSRKQDVAFQKVRETIHERHHIRLWMTSMRILGKPVWIGAASRDIGVIFTSKTWNLMTHRIDPDIDDARDYLIEDLLIDQRLAALGVVSGVGETPASAPRDNMIGSEWYTDGNRAVLILGKHAERPQILDWQLPKLAQRSNRPSATFKISSKWIGAGFGVRWGQGELRFRGKRYAFAVKGLGLFDLGVAHTSARGEVFGLKEIGDLEGAYTAIEGGATLLAGGSMVTARNQRGVMVKIISESRGVQLKIGVGGIDVRLVGDPE